jgi:hypothetical protein
MHYPRLPSGAGTIGQLVADVPGGLSLTPPLKKKTGKVKVKWYLGLINNAPLYDEIWRSEGIAPPFLTSALDGVEWPASRPRRFTSGETAPSTHFIGGWYNFILYLMRG